MEVYLGQLDDRARDQETEWGGGRERESYVSHVWL